VNKLSVLVASGALALSTLGTSGAASAANRVNNIVLVHGAFADGSGWRPVYDRLVAKGYHVSLVQEPETGLADDIAATRRVIDMQDGPVVLVGHSWGGQVITDAGTDDKVRSLVYVAALVPDVGESTASLHKRIPAASKAVKPLPDGYLYIDPAQFPADFAGDLPKADADFMAQSQVNVIASSLDTPAKAAASARKRR
jgi:pimeloyl-ACP methyl ester carboxylesterase